MIKKAATKSPCKHIQFIQAATKIVLQKNIFLD